MDWMNKVYPGKSQGKFSFVFIMVAQTMASQLMSDSSLKKYQADTPEHIDDPDVTATALSCLPGECI